MAENSTLDERIKIRVGEKLYHTTKATVSESTLLTSMLAAPPDDQGEYYVDNDPELFDHIIRYLRTKVFPIFFDKVRGHDAYMYLAVHRQAKFYNIQKLDNWLALKSYQDAVKCKQRFITKKFYGEKQIQESRDKFSSYETMSIVKFADTVERCWRCPRMNWRHDGDRKTCINTRCIAGSQGKSYENTLTREVEVMVSSVEIQEEICVPIGPEQLEPPPYRDVAGSGAN